MTNMTNVLNQSTSLPRLTKTKGFILTVLIAGALAAPFLISAPRAQGQNEQSETSQPPRGSWLVQVTLDPNTVPPGTPFLTFMALYTFSDGGGYVQNNTGPGAGGALCQGNWVRTGHDKAAGTLLRFGFDTANHFTSLNRIRDSFSFNKEGDELTGSFQTDIFLPNGTLLGAHPAGTYQGTRIAIEPVN
jgi:hypothetical protein